MLIAIGVDIRQAERPIRFEEHGTSKANNISRTSPPGSIQDEGEQSCSNPQTKDRGKYTVWGGLRATLFASWITIALIPTVPAGFAVKYTNQSPVVTFAVKFVAIIPLAQVLDAVTEELVIGRGGHEGMLIVVTFGYALSGFLDAYADNGYKQCHPIGHHHHRSDQRTNTYSPNLPHRRSHLQQCAHGVHWVFLRRRQSNRAALQSIYLQYLIE